MSGCIRVRAGSKGARLGRGDMSRARMWNSCSVHTRGRWLSSPTSTSLPLVYRDSYLRFKDIGKLNRKSPEPSSAQWHKVAGSFTEVPGTQKDAIKG